MVNDVNSVSTTSGSGAPKGGDRPESVGSTGNQESSAELQTGKSDSLSLSSEGKLLSGLAAQIDKAPVINQERVAELQNAIANGQYPIDPSILAQNIIDIELS